MLARHIAVVRVYNGKDVIVKSENSQRNKNQGTNTWVAGHDWLFDGGKFYPL